MQFFILDEVLRLGKEDGIYIDSEIDDAGNLYFTRGEGKDGYPCVVSHMDTVHDIVPKGQFKIVRYGDTWHGFNPVQYEMTGIGGDDKVGVYTCLEALRQHENIKVAFFTDEEMGCVGSSQANMSWFDDCNLVLQADRRGNDDFVQFIGGTDLFGTEFSDAVTPLLNDHGYIVCKWGGITDVGELKERGLKVACANMSAGYHNPHCDNEYIVLKEVENVLNLIFAIIRDLGGKRWDHEAVPFKYSSSTKSYPKATVYDDQYATDWDRAMGRVWSETSYYMNDRYIDHSEPIDDTLDLEKAPESNTCVFCGSMSVQFDPTEEDHFCFDCNDYTALEWSDDDRSDMGLSEVLSNDRDLLVDDAPYSYDKYQTKKKTKTTNRRKKGKVKVLA